MPARKDSDADSSCLQHLDAVAIMAIKCLDLLATIGKIKASVGENAVDIKYDCPDIPGFFQYMVHAVTAVVAKNFQQGG